MKTNPSVATMLSHSLPPAQVSPRPAAPPQAGRPSSRNAGMIDGLCAIIRETGVSDSGAAARMGVHPSTVSRWKKEAPDLAILLRSAREEFRLAQLDIILSTARSGMPSSWRAAAWVLEKVFPQDYAPRAEERAKFQEMHDAACASEAEGSELELPGAPAQPPAAHRDGALQNVQNPGIAAPSAPDLTLDDAAGGVLAGLPLPGMPLQNVKKSALAGPIHPPVAATRIEVRG